MLTVQTLLIVEAKEDFFFSTLAHTHHARWKHGEYLQFPTGLDGWKRGEYVVIMCNNPQA